MTLIQRYTESGFVVAEEAFDEARLSRALKQIDDRLVLQVRNGMYVVVCCVSENHAPVICGWHDRYGQPLPLSSGLLEKVHQLRVDARNKPIDADEHNRRHAERLEADTQERLAAIRDEHRPYVERSRVQVTLANVGKRRYWQRDGQQPRSGASR